MIGKLNLSLFGRRKTVGINENSSSCFVQILVKWQLRFLLLVLESCLSYQEMRDTSPKLCAMVQILRAHKDTGLRCSESYGVECIHFAGYESSVGFFLTKSAYDINACLPTQSSVCVIA